MRVAIHQGGFAGELESIGSHIYQPIFAPNWCA